MIRLLAMLLAGLPLLATASPRDDYAWQWPLALSTPDAGAYRVELDASIYRRVLDPALGDIAVLDADGRAVPAALLAPQLANTVRRIRAPVFALPTGTPGAARLRVLAQADAEGRLRSVELVDAQDAAVVDTLIVDMTDVRAPVSSLEFDLPGTAPLDRGFARVEAGDDLDRWQSVSHRGRLVDLAQNGRRIRQRALHFDAPVQARFLRLTFDTAGAMPAPASVAAVVRGTARAPMQWETLTSASTSSKEFEFTFPGRLPVEQVDVAMPGNAAMRWRLFSRDDASAPWRERAAWSAFRVEAHGRVTQSAPRVFAATVRDRHWRLVADAPSPATPTLRLGYRPETVAFIAQGRAPYALVAGSAHARRVDAPVQAPLDDLRRANGADSAPARATAGAPIALAGDSALRPRRDTSTWLLWGVLALGALLVAGFALRLLRAAPSREAR